MSDVLILDSGADKIKIGKGFYSYVIKVTHSCFINYESLLHKQTICHGLPWVPTWNFHGPPH